MFVIARPHKASNKDGVLRLLQWRAGSAGATDERSAFADCSRTTSTMIVMDWSFEATALPPPPYHILLFVTVM
jgi:hypothetical protein